MLKGARVVGEWGQEAKGWRRGLGKRLILRGALFVQFEDIDFDFATGARAGESRSKRGNCFEFLLDGN